MRRKLPSMLLRLTMPLSVFPATAVAVQPDSSLNEDVEAAVKETETATPEKLTAEPTDGKMRKRRNLQGNKSGKPNATVSVSVKFA